MYLNRRVFVMEANDLELHCCKGRVYPGSAELGLKHVHNFHENKACYFIQIASKGDD